MCIYTYILKFSELMSNHYSKSLKKMCVFISNIFDSHFSLNQYSLVSHWTRIYTVCLRLHELQVSICLEYCLYLLILCFVLLWLWCKQTKVSRNVNPPISQGWLNLTVWYLKKINWQVWLSYIHQVIRGITSRCVLCKIVWIH